MLTTREGSCERSAIRQQRLANQLLEQAVDGGKR